MLGEDVWVSVRNLECIQMKSVGDLINLMVL